MSAQVTQVTARGDHSTAVAKRAHADWEGVDTHWIIHVDVGRGEWAWTYGSRFGDPAWDKCAAFLDECVAKADQAWERVLEAQAVRDASKMLDPAAPRG